MYVSLGQPTASKNAGFPQQSCLEKAKANIRPKEAQPDVSFGDLISTKDIRRSNTASNVARIDIQNIGFCGSPAYRCSFYLSQGAVTTWIWRIIIFVLLSQGL